MVEAPLPIQTQVAMENGGLNKFVLRLTPQGRYEDDEICSYLIEHFDKFVVAVEMRPQKHYHVVLVTERSLVAVRTLIVYFLHTKWPIRARGWGNAQYNLAIAKENTEGLLDSAVSYALKENTLLYQCGYDMQYIEQCLQESFTPNRRQSYVAQMQALNTEFQNTEMTKNQYCARFMVVKAEHGQAIRMVDVIGQWQAALVRKLGLAGALQLINQNVITN